MERYAREHGTVFKRIFKKIYHAYLIPLKTKYIISAVSISISEEKHIPISN